MNIQQNVSLKNLSSMKIGGVGKEYIEAQNEQEVLSIIKYAKDNNLKVFIIGDGTNTIFTDNEHEMLFVKLNIKGIHKTYDGPEFANIEAGAGEDWDDLVKWCVDHNLSGLECLSYIPGTVGASPIQNIGAYGSEASDTISKVKVINIETNEIEELSSDQCEFGYRDSVFKRNPGRYIIVSVSFSLSKKHTDLEVPQYKDVQLYFLTKKQKLVSAKEIRDAVIEIRKDKLPDPKVIPNTGSFFKNPVVSTEEFSILLENTPEIPHSKVGNDIKIYAGWLIQECGLKGHNFGKIKVDNKSALILTNPKGKGDYKDLESAINQIKAQVYEKFNIELEVEPNII